MPANIQRMPAGSSSTAAAGSSVADSSGCSTGSRRLTPR